MIDVVINIANSLVKCGSDSLGGREKVTYQVEKKTNM